LTLLPAGVLERPDVIEAELSVQRDARVVRQRDARNRRAKPALLHRAEQLVVERSAQATAALERCHVDADLARPCVRVALPPHAGLRVADDGARGLIDRRILGDEPRKALPRLLPERAQILCGARLVAEVNRRGLDVVVRDRRDRREILSARRTDEHAAMLPS